MRRMFWNAVGFVSLALGMAGVILPLVPTVPFVLVAAFAFGQGSPRFRRWLVMHPRFGPPITRWEAHGAIERRYKWMAVLGCAMSLLVTVAIGVPATVLAVQAACLAGAMTYVLTRPDGPPPE